jgi:hypothetical protein
LKGKRDPIIVFNSQDSLLHAKAEGWNSVAMLLTNIQSLFAMNKESDELLVRRYNLLLDNVLI